MSGPARVTLRSRSRVVAALCGVGVLNAWAGAPDKAEPDIQQVVITTTPLHESPLETAQPTSIVAGEDLVRMRALSLGETLAAQPGITATYFGPQASRPVIRGLGGERVQMYEDGGEALDVSALSSDHSVSIDPLMAKRIEVIRGPATLLYGSGASGGLINVLTDRVPEETSKHPLWGALELRGDSALGERAAATHIDGGAGMWAWHADAHKRRTRDVAIPGFALSKALREQLAAAGEEADGTRDTLTNTASETYGGAVGGSWIGDRALAGIGVSRFDTSYGIPDTGGESGVHIEMRQTRYDMKAELRHIGDRITTARLRASYNDYTHGEVEASGEIGTLFQQKGVDTRLVFDHAPLGGWRGTFGVQYRHVDLAVSGEEALVPASETRNVGYFVFEERSFGAVTLEVGTRLEGQQIDVASRSSLPDYDDHSFSASAGALWKAREDYSVALNLTSTERQPTATELYADGPHIAAQRFEVGDTALARERATTIDLGLRKIAGSWRGSFTAFRSDYSRYIFAAPTGDVTEDEDALPIYQYGQGNATFTGFEAELVPPAAESRIGIVSSRVMADYVRARLNTGSNLPQMPPRRLGAEVTLEHKRFSWQLAVMRYAKQSRVVANELPTDGYTMLDMDLSYRMPLPTGSVLLFLRGQNLLDEDARRHSSPLKDFAPLPGLSVAGGVHVEF